MQLLFPIFVILAVSKPPPLESSAWFSDYVVFDWWLCLNCPGGLCSLLFIAWPYRFAVFGMLCAVLWFVTIELASLGGIGTGIGCAGCQVGGNISSNVKNTHTTHHTPQWHCKLRPRF